MLSEQNGSKPAYPQYQEHHAPNIVENITEGGLTKREMFAMAAMQGLMSVPDKGSFKGMEDMVRSCAENAIMVADELLKQLES